MSTCEISTDRDRLDVDAIHQFLAGSYWAKNIPREIVEDAIAGSLCFGAYKDDTFIGFGRVITDYATFGYLADIFVLPEYRGLGVGKQLAQAMMDHPRMQGLRRVMLSTADAHGLYTPLGFEQISDPEKYMTIHRPDMYSGNG